MNRKIVVIGIPAIFLVGAIAWMVMSGPKAPEVAAPVRIAAPPIKVREMPVAPIEQAQMLAESPAPAKMQPLAKTDSQTEMASPKRLAQNNAATGQGGRPAKEPIKDPKAREALALVGLDPEAEAYWYAAINDPTLSAKERQDLIEDLNEDGLSDPKHPGMEDLPTILSRLELIEAVAPDAMDKVNADAFREAYKDLVNLANVATGGGEPVD